MRFLDRTIALALWVNYPQVSFDSVAAFLPFFFLVLLFLLFLDFFYRLWRYYCRDHILGGELLRPCVIYFPSILDLTYIPAWVKDFCFPGN